MGRVALVTGAARGIGAATVAALAAAGWHGAGRRPRRRRPHAALPARHRGRPRRRWWPAARRATGSPLTSPTSAMSASSRRPSTTPNNGGAGWTPPSPSPASSAAARRTGRPTRPSSRRCSTSTSAVCSTWPASPCPPCYADPSRAAAASWPSPRPPRRADCPCSPPTAPQRPASPASSGRWPSSWPAPASRPTRSVPARPAQHCWTRAPGSTACPTRPSSPTQQPIQRLHRRRPRSPRTLVHLADAEAGATTGAVFADRRRAGAVTTTLRDGEVPLPQGFRVRLDETTTEVEPGVLVGGRPMTVLRLTEAGADAWAEVQAGPVSSRAAGTTGPAPHRRRPGPSRTTACSRHRDGDGRDPGARPRGRTRSLPRCARPPLPRSSSSTTRRPTRRPSRR